MEHEFSYELTQEEVEQGILLFQKLKHGRRTLVETVLLSVMALFFLVSFIVYREWFNVAMGCLYLAVIAALQLVPKLDQRQQAKIAERSMRIQLLYSDGPDVIQVWTGQGNVEIPMDQDTEVRQGADVVIVSPAKGGLLIVPKRAIQDDAFIRIFLK